MHNRVDLKEY